jgi:nicotinate-nucleotide pyrophosphorylase (carboxylating)
VAERLDPAVYRDVVRRAVAEDVGPGDVTTWAIVPPGSQGRATILAKCTCVLAGLEVAREVFHQIDGTLEFAAVKLDGQMCGSGDPIARIAGRVSPILSAERTALNFVQHLSGIATQTRRFVDAAGGALTVLDTRHTLPTLRALEKYAVRCGGGGNRRVGLYDGVLIADHHVRVAGGVAEAVRRFRSSGSSLPIEIEVQSLPDVDEALTEGVDAIRLDNLDDGTMREAIRRIAGRARVEISGTVTLERIRLLAMMGADCVSIAALTQAAPAMDISLEIETE